MDVHSVWLRVFFFNDTATTEIYTLSLHDALPIFAVLDPLDEALLELRRRVEVDLPAELDDVRVGVDLFVVDVEVQPCSSRRSEEHTSELQSRQYLVCRLLLEKKK